MSASLGHARLNTQQTAPQKNKGLLIASSNGEQSGLSVHNLIMTFGTSAVTGIEWYKVRKFVFVAKGLNTVRCSSQTRCERAIKNITLMRVEIDGRRLARTD